MRINKTKIQSFTPYKRGLIPNQEFYVGLPIEDTNEFLDTLSRIGFKDISEGNVVLPAITGRATKYNSAGKEIVRKDLPKETVEYPVQWTWKDWSGKEYEEVRYRQVQRYPRRWQPAPSLEMEIRAKNENLSVVIGPFINEVTDDNLIVHGINLFLENFGYCDVLNSNFANLTMGNLRRLNWDIFPEGEYPWDKIQGHLQQVINRAKTGNRPVIEDRFKTFTDYNPSFYACGRAGFSDYVVFGYKDLGIYILESNHLGNATYVFGNDWKKLSQMTKAQIIQGDKATERLVHSRGWHGKIGRLFTQAGYTSSKSA